MNLDSLKKTIAKLIEEKRQKQLVNQTHLQVLPELIKTISPILEEIQKQAGPEGQKGDKGEKGDPGLQGEPGKPGRDGLNGNPGQNGKDGLNGQNGKDGKSIKGEPGVNGKDGKNGLDGQNGKDGVDGSSDTGADLVRKINNLPAIPAQQIDASHIKNISNIIVPYGGGRSSQSSSTSTSTTTEFTSTTTGNIDDLDFSNANVIRMNNASLATIRGLKAGTAGQQVTIVSIGAGNVGFANQSANSSANNRLINITTSADTPLAAGKGSVIYEYDVTTLRWRLLNHEQGDWITPAFSAANFTADTGSWTVVSGNITSCQYYLKGRVIFVNFSIDATTVGGAPNQLIMAKATFGGFTPQTLAYVGLQHVFDAGAFVAANPFASGVSFYFTRFDAATFTAGSATYCRSIGTFAVT